MEQTKVKGLVIRFLPTAMTIENSYKIRNIDKMSAILIESLGKTETFTTPRSIMSFINQWLVYNNLYKFHLFRKHTTNIIFKDEQSKIKRIIFVILSFPNKIKYKISNIKKNKKIKKNTKLYKQYIEEHKENVMKAFDEMSNNHVIFQIGGDDLMNKLYNRVIHHDESKYSVEEFEPYRKNFFPISQQEKEENQSAFEKAWQHHWQNNSHHWQYRQYKNTFNKNNDEEVLDVLENVLDWMAMGYKFHDRPYQYYENNKNHILLNEEERKFLEYVIYEGIDADYLATSKNYVTKEELDDTTSKKRRFKLWKKKNK